MIFRLILVVSFELLLYSCSGRAVSVLVLLVISQVQVLFRNHVCALICGNSIRSAEHDSWLLVNANEYERTHWIHSNVMGFSTTQVFLAQSVECILVDLHEVPRVILLQVRWLHSIHRLEQLLAQVLFA